MLHWDERLDLKSGQGRVSKAVLSHAIFIIIIIKKLPEMNNFLVNSSSLKIKLAFRIRYEKFSKVHLVFRYFIK